MGNAMVSRGNAGWTTSNTGHHCPCQNCSKGLPVKRLKEDLCRIVPHVPQQPSQSRVWTELNCPSIQKLKSEKKYVGFLDRGTWNLINLQFSLEGWSWKMLHCPKMITVTYFFMNLLFVKHRQFAWCKILLGSFVSGGFFFLIIWIWIVKIYQFSNK